MAATTKRAIAEKKIFELMDSIEKTTNGYNATRWKSHLSKMSDKQFNDFMVGLSKTLTDPDHKQLFFEINSSSDNGSPKLKDLINLSSKVGVPIREYIFFPHKNPDDPNNPAITRTPVIKIIVPVRRLQQFLDKKNAASSDSDSVNHMTGQVTGDSKSAAITDTQTASLATTGEFDTLKEFMGPRSDDMKSKMQMIRSIEQTGTVSLADLNINKKNKQSLRLMEVYLRGAGFKSNIFEGGGDDE